MPRAPVPEVLSKTVANVRNLDQKNVTELYLRCEHIRRACHARQDLALGVSLSNDAEGITQKTVTRRRDTAYLCHGSPTTTQQEGGLLAK
jgi:hypothetical protein